MMGAAAMAAAAASVTKTAPRLATDAMTISMSMLVVKKLLVMASRTALMMLAMRTKMAISWQ